MTAPQVIRRVRPTNAEMVERRARASALFSRGYDIPAVAEGLKVSVETARRYRDWWLQELYQQGLSDARLVKAKTLHHLAGLLVGLLRMANDVNASIVARVRAAEAARENLMTQLRIQGLWSEKVEVTGADGGPIQIAEFVHLLPSNVMTAIAQAPIERIGEIVAAAAEVEPRLLPLARRLQPGGGKPSGKPLEIRREGGS